MASGRVSYQLHSHNRFMVIEFLLLLSIFLVVCSPPDGNREIRCRVSVVETLKRPVGNVSRSELCNKNVKLCTDGGMRKED